MKIITIFIIFFLTISKCLGFEINGITLNQNIKNIIINPEDNISSHKVKWDNELLIYLNNELGNYKKKYIHFSLNKPDFLFDRFVLYSRNNIAESIVGTRLLNKYINQKDFDSYECNSLRAQLIAEKLVKKFDQKKIERIFLKTSDENYYFKDRIIFTTIINDSPAKIYFTCTYIIKEEQKKTYNDKKNFLILSSLVFAIAKPNFFNNVDIYHRWIPAKKFNGNDIKNFKPWGNFDNKTKSFQILSLKNYSLSEYRNINQQKNLKKNSKIQTEEKKLEAKQKSNEEQKKTYDASDITAALIDKAKEKEKAEKINKTDKVTQDQNKNIEFEGLSLSESDVLKAQIFRCWSIPLGLPYKEDLIVRIKLKLNRDGSVLSSEILDHDRMNRPGQVFYKVLAESVLRAIKICQPLRVPSEGYDNWKELILNFDAREML